MVHQVEMQGKYCCEVGVCRTVGIAVLLTDHYQLLLVVFFKI